MRSHWRMFRTFVVSLGVAALLAGCELPTIFGPGITGLQVITTDATAGVYLNDTLSAKTPYINKELKPGEYTVTIKPDRLDLAPYTTKINLRRGVLSVIIWKPGARPETSGGVMYELEELSNGQNTELSFTTIPDGAIMQLDGQAKGFAPVLLDKITAGPHQYQVSLPSYETQQHDINVLAGYRTNVTVKLAKQLGTPNDQVSTTTVTATTSATVFSPSPLTAGTLATISTPLKGPLVAPPKVRINPTGFVVNGQEVLRVRNAATPAGQEIGQAPVGTEYPYLNEKLDGWLKITFNNQIGWVSTQFVQLIEK